MVSLTCTGESTIRRIMATSIFCILSNSDEGGGRRGPRRLGGMFALRSDPTCTGMAYASEEVCLDKKGVLAQATHLGAGDATSVDTRRCSHPTTAHPASPARVPGTRTRIYTYPRQMYRYNRLIYVCRGTLEAYRYPL